ncbi:GntR family transcriptional regulator [Streptomyces cylindrosporus]|uniref:GntR family transcriptional regulator n=1 Tax=Streptomyces cylindrosporus TaxID=2927583 RepID=A0ABS9YPF8_9ACTN|nr:GntR family transcriptional regulator [Streptomyces cylindrosporus]MCI3279124.1 GntR family transcriptional regulator [Streptomyces cylindrosporus]
MSGKAGYAEIATHYRRLISDGTLVPGEPMPTMKDVCKQFGVAIATANRAFQILKAERLTVGKPGVGTVVAERPRVATTAAARLKRIGRTGDPYGYKEKSIKHTAALRSADAAVAEALHIDLHDEIVLRTRVFVRDTTPTIAALSCIHVRALEAVPELLSTEPMGRFWQEIYTERTGRTVTKSPERRTARLASQNELDLLEVRVPESVPVPVLILVNVFHDEDGPLEYWEDVYGPSLWQSDDE